MATRVRLCGDRGRRPAARAAALALGLVLATGREVGWTEAAKAQDAPPTAPRTVREPASGLAVTLPAGFDATIADPLSGDAQLDVAFEGRPACRIVFSARPGPRPDLAALRARIDTPEWRADLARRAGEGAGSTERFEVAGAVGGVVEAQNLVLYALDTPSGRTTLFCMGDGGGAHVRPRWDALAKGLRPPP